METLREFIAAIIFIVGAVIIFSILERFSWDMLFAGITCFVIAYFIWPSKRRGNREGDSYLLDILELIIEFPVELFSWLFRLLARLFRSKDGGLDIDIDL